MPSARTGYPLIFLYIFWPGRNYFARSMKPVNGYITVKLLHGIMEKPNLNSWFERFMEGIDNDWHEHGSRMTFD
jgi:hypothetical protein